MTVQDAIGGERLKKFEVRLESQTDDQARIVTLNARDEFEARVRCEVAELEVIQYDLRKDPWLSAKDISEIEGKKYQLLESGKVAGPNARFRAKLHQAAQTQPYKVASISEMALDAGHVDRLVAELALLHQDKKAWEQILKRLKDEGIPLNVLGFWYGVPAKNQYDGTAVIDWDTDTMKVALLLNHTFQQDTHDFFNDVSAQQITGTGYTAGGATLGSKTATYDTASDQVRLDAGDTTWGSSTLTADGAVVWKDTGTPSTSPVMVGIDFEGDVSTTNGTFQITWDSTGIAVRDLT